MSLRLRLRIGGILLSAVCLAGFLLIANNLNALKRNQEVFTFKDTLFHTHHHTLEQIQGAQSTLYQHKAGYTRDIDSLVGKIIASESLLTRIPRTYRRFASPDYCSTCHLNTNERVFALENKLGIILDNLDKYKQNISILITSTDVDAQAYHHEKANQLGQDIIRSIVDINRAAGLMVNEILSTNTALVQRSRITVTAVVACVILIALAILLYTQYSINQLITSLLRGTNSIYRDVFSLRLPTSNRRD